MTRFVVQGHIHIITKRQNLHLLSFIFSLFCQSAPVKLFQTLYDSSANEIRARFIYLLKSCPLSQSGEIGRVLASRAGVETTAAAHTVYLRMATAACSTQSTLNPCTGKLHREHLRKSKDSRRRQAALLFLTNISLDGRPVRNNVSAAGPSDAEFQCSDIGATVSELSAAASSDGTFSSLSVPRLGLLNVPPILVLPSDSGFSNAGSTEMFLERDRGSFSSQNNLLSPCSLLPTPLGARKSPTLLSVQSCGSSLESRPRWVLHRFLNGGFTLMHSDSLHKLLKKTVHLAVSQNLVSCLHRCLNCQGGKVLRW